MGYLKTIPIDTLILPSDPGFTVRMRARATYGITKAAQSAMIQTDTSYADEAGRPLEKARVITKSEWSSYINALLLGVPEKGVAGLLVDWNLTDENDQPLPLTVASLDKLDPADGKFLQDEADKRNQLRGRTEQEDFKSPSS